jgi:hypothetical protein
MTAPESDVLTVVIPALNEEEAIGDTVRRCLEARAHVVASTPLRDMEIVVVSDGSTDRTVEIASGFEEVTVLTFVRNRGYGAAIKCGYAHGRGDLVGFLDADGTCDPRFFADLCGAIYEQNADLALGSRMGPNSEMPLIRTIGNTIFAWILGALSKRTVQDTASGMRVMRRSALPDLYPLPDGLHFTPAMSARVLIQDKLKLVELPMTYAERVGASKLSVLKDGVRFLNCIVKAAVAYRPSRPLLAITGVLGLFALLVGIGPVLYYLQQGELREPQIYRILLSSLLATSSAILLCSALVADRIAALAHDRPAATHGLTGTLGRVFTSRARLVEATGLLVAAVVIVWPGIVEYVSTGEVTMHWSRAMLSSLFIVVAVVIGVTSFLFGMLDLIQAQRANEHETRPPDDIRRAIASRPSRSAETAESA